MNMPTPLAGITMNIYSIPVTTINETLTTLEEYKGQVLLIVNVASRCGFTSQYQKLEQLQKDYHKQGFTVLGFPCNQFLNQEPDSNLNIQAFATSCYRISFPMFAKINVKGKNQAPLYNYLMRKLKSWWFIPWNFTKILVDRNGNVIKQFWPTTSFKALRKNIEQQL